MTLAPPKTSRPPMPAPSVLRSVPRTIWGLDAVQLHARYWASFGVQVVRQGEPSQIVKQAELYLLTDPRSLPLFDLRDVIETLNWVEPQVLFIRLHDTRERGYREHVRTTGTDGFERFERIYDSAGRLARVVLTPEREIARLWQSAADPVNGWRRLRRFTPRSERVTCSIDGLVYDRTSDREMAEFLHDLVRDWKHPSSTVRRATRKGDAWCDRDSQTEGARLIGPVWVGAGRTLAPGQTIVGPAVLWDDPASRPLEEDLRWLTIEPSLPPAEPEVRQITPLAAMAKRTFDIAFALVALLITLPLWPLIMLAIYIEDGRPFFFAHRRESRGGREFPCLKFRSMRKDAEKIKQELIAKNQADGPQFFMENDPRLTKVGRFLRKMNADEFPQFLNVLTGDMSIVGPRPSPRKENQFCPAWREARLSVRPGITGLWQTSRTRRAGTDFQEWIKYDIEYVESMSPWLDIRIIWRTIMQIVRKGTR